MRVVPVPQDVDDGCALPPEDCFRADDAPIDEDARSRGPRIEIADEPVTGWHRHPP